MPKKRKAESNPTEEDDSSSRKKQKRGDGGDKAPKKKKTTNKKKRQKKPAAGGDQQVSVPDGWKEPKFTRGDNPHGMVAESSFAVMFPKYRERYLRERWALVRKKLGEAGVKGELDLARGTMTVSTTRGTWDPYAILNARDCVRLLSRSVPLEQALRVLEDGVACDIVKIRGMVANDARFIRRRQRLIGPDGSTLKAIEIITGCYVLVQGGTVAAVGPYKGLKEVRKVVEDCMKNVHPIYTVRIIMLRHELEKDPVLRHESWDRFIPKWKNRNVKRKVPLKVRRKKKEYTPFPPPQLERKVDRELASGEYFLKQSEKQQESKKKMEKSHKKKEENDRQKRLSFIPPKEK